MKVWSGIDVCLFSGRVCYRGTPLVRWVPVAFPFLFPPRMGVPWCFALFKRCRFIGPYIGGACPPTSLVFPFFPPLIFNCPQPPPLPGFLPRRERGSPTTEGWFFRVPSFHSPYFFPTSFLFVVSPDAIRRVAPPKKLVPPPETPLLPSPPFPGVFFPFLLIPLSSFRPVDRIPSDHFST